MSDQEGPKVPKRGDAAWKAEKDGIAARNDQARKAARLEREAHQQNTRELRRQSNERRAANVTPRPDLG